MASKEMEEVVEGKLEPIEEPEEDAEIQAGTSQSASIQDDGAAEKIIEKENEATDGAIEKTITKEKEKTVEVLSEDHSLWVKMDLRRFPQMWNLVSTPLQAKNRRRLTNKVSALMSGSNVNYTLMSHYHKLKPLIQYIRAHGQGISHPDIDESKKLTKNEMKKYMKDIIHGFVYPETIEKPHSAMEETLDTASLLELLEAPLIMENSSSTKPSGADNQEAEESVIDINIAEVLKSVNVVNKPQGDASLSPLIEYIKAHPEGISHPEVSDLAELSTRDKEDYINMIVELIIDPQEETANSDVEEVLTLGALEEILSPVYMDFSEGHWQLEIDPLASDSPEASDSSNKQ